MPFGLSKATVLGAAGSGSGEGGTFEWIAGITVSDSSTSSITFNSLDAATYRELFIRWSLLSGTTPDDVNLQLNGNTGSNYYSNEWWTHNSNSGKNGFSGQAHLRLVWSAGTSSSYASPMAGIINISDANTSTQTSIESLAYRSYDTGSSYGTFDYATTLLSAGSNYTISSVTLKRSSQNFTSGDTFQLFGAKSSSS